MTEFATHRADPAMSFVRAVATAAEAIRATRVAGHAEMLMVISAVAFDPPSLSARHQMARLWAEMAEGRITLGIVCPPNLIDAEKFAVLSARNFGLHCDVFTDEAEAVAWLRVQRASRERQHRPLAAVAEGSPGESESESESESAVAPLT